MEVVQDESIPTSSTASVKSYGNPRQRMDLDHNQHTVDTTMSNLSVETHPPSCRNRNIFSSPSVDTLDSRQDSPKEEQGTADMNVDDPSNDTSPKRNGFHQTASNAVPDSLRTIPYTTNSRSITEETRTTSNASGGSNGMTVAEEKVSLAPRFGMLERSHYRHGEPEESVGEPDNLFSISGSMSSEFLEHQHPDHQQEYLGQSNQLPSPTSTARDFLRETHLAPSLPTHDGERGVTITRVPTNFGGSLPLRQSNQRPPFHPPTAAGSSTITSNNPSFSNSHPFQPIPMREQMSSAHSPSPTNSNIPGVGSFCDNNSGRDKPVISRCFAWSQDSQEDRRITKRPRTLQECGDQGVSSGVSSPTDTVSVMSPSTALETIRSDDEEREESSSPSQQEILSMQQHHDALSSPLSPSHTKVHWEEKVEDSNELMSHAVGPQVLFNSTATITVSAANEDVTMKGDKDVLKSHNSDMNPPIAIAHSASHYSFESS